MVKIENLKIGKKYRSTDSENLVELVSIDKVENGIAVLTVKDRGVLYFGFNFRLSEVTP